MFECRKPYKRTALVLPQDHDIKSHDGTRSKKAKTGSIYYSCDGVLFRQQTPQATGRPRKKVEPALFLLAEIDRTPESRRL